jgi:hypothetical protein
MTTTVALSADDRSRIQRYHGVLSTALGAGDVSRIDFRFRENHRLKPGDPILPALKAIMAAHQSRVAGTGSPKECDDVAKKVVS